MRGKNLISYGRIQSDKRRTVSAVVGAMIVAEVLRGLQVAHKQWCVHRDVKARPSWSQATAKSGRLTDFGIAKHHATNITVAGKFLGSPSYSSPNKYKGKRSMVDRICMLPVFCYMNF